MCSGSTRASPLVVHILWYDHLFSDDYFEFQIGMEMWKTIATKWIDSKTNNGQRDAIFICVRVHACVLYNFNEIKVEEKFACKYIYQVICTNESEPKKKKTSTNNNNSKVNRLPLQQMCVRRFFSHFPPKIALDSSVYDILSVSLRLRVCWEISSKLI